MTSPSRTAGADQPLVIRGATHRTRLIDVAQLDPGRVRVGGHRGQATHLDPGDALVLYTDGVTEARDPQRRLFGERRLRAVASAHAAGSADSIAEAIIAAVRRFADDAPASDDLTLIVIRRLG